MKYVSKVVAAAVLGFTLAGCTGTAMKTQQYDASQYTVLGHSEASLLFVGKLDTWPQQEPGVPATLPRIALPLSPPTAFDTWDQIIGRTHLSNDRNTGNDAAQTAIQVGQAQYRGTWQGTTSAGRTIRFVVDENDVVANLIIAQMLFLESEDPDKEITLYVNSPGGSITAVRTSVDASVYTDPGIAVQHTGSRVLAYGYGELRAWRTSGADAGGSGTVVAGLGSAASATGRTETKVRPLRPFL